MAGNRNADELLKWSIANTGDGTATTQIAADIAAGNRPDLADPKLYEAIMGKSEAQMMREELGTALDTTRSDEDRCTALDNFEMLIEQIDNANNISSMKMWQPLLSLLDGSNSPGIHVGALWIVGTAVQNNPAAQVAILPFEPLAPVLALLDSHDTEVRSKAMYALSAILKFNHKAMQQFQEMDGWSRLQSALLGECHPIGSGDGDKVAPTADPLLQDPSINLRRRTAFLLNALLVQDVSHDASSAPSAPIGLIAPAADPSTAALSSSSSTATAIAPSPSSTTTSATSSSIRTGTHAPPLEKDPAASLRSVPHPDVQRAFLSSGLLRTLLLSLLPSDATEDADDDNNVEDGGETAEGDRAPGTQDHALAGPDGDLDPRNDLDYAEKAAAACLTFVNRAAARRTQGRHDVSADALPRSLLRRLKTDLEGPPLEGGADDEGFKTRREELGWDDGLWDTFSKDLSAVLG